MAALSFSRRTEHQQATIATQEDDMTNFYDTSMNRIIHYRNPWHRPGRPEYGPAIYSTGATPIEYRGHLIYHRQTNVWDVVKDGACVTQCAGLGGAKRAVDAILAQETIHIEAAQ